MKLYEINEKIAAFGNEENFVDMETGEILDPEAIAKLRSEEYKNLQMERTEKLTNIALLEKNTEADVKALDAEIKTLMARKKAKQATVDWCKATLTDELQGKKMEDARFKITWRKSESVEYDDWHTLPLDVLEEQPPKVSKTMLKKFLKEGQIIAGARLVVKQNIQIH